MLVIAGVALNGTIDNLLRPYLSRRGHLQLPTFGVLLAMFGGIELMGGWGAIMRPTERSASRASISTACIQRYGRLTLWQLANAERYYRVMYYGAAESWNLRDQHMFDTLRSIQAHRGNAKIVVWEHNSHVGDASATEMAARGEHNVGKLCRDAFGDNMYSVGFGTDHGTVAAAHDWDGPMQTMRVRPARADSYERLCHDAEVPAFLLPLRTPARDALRDELAAPRLERAIGVVYRPDTELASHYFQAILPAQ